MIVVLPEKKKDKKHLRAGEVEGRLWMSYGWKKQASFLKHQNGRFWKVLYNNYQNWVNRIEDWKSQRFKGEVRTINDRNMCERRSCMKNNGKSPTSNSFLERRDARRKFSESLGTGASLAPHTRQRISLGSENDWKFRLRRCQSWKASSLSLGVVVPT